MHTIRTLCLAFLAGTFLFLAGCQATNAISQGGAAAETAETRAVTAYTLGTGDQLRINVYGHQDLSGEFEVDGTGAVSLPLVGQVDALGLTTPQLESKIVEKLDGDYILNPRVSVEVTNYRPYYVLGEVGSPGEYPYSSGLTVLNAVAAAGGFTYRAKKNVVFIKSADSNKEVAYRLDTSTAVKPGDTLRIEERIF
ncbi:MAG: polysaccharide export protein [Alphaproteobacteria bacterium]|nr:polysaccharide biosynthesis protein [Hyphomonas sp.]MBR9807571.1 polysaccharide export protein [Alphaproteobacteria bacterium]|tara:strand:+ start:5474 stop:6061 length:588 start_codon:yes stop_codon:yes gene_type:complete